MQYEIQGDIRFGFVSSFYQRRLGKGSESRVAVVKSLQMASTEDKNSNITKLHLNKCFTFDTSTEGEALVDIIPVMLIRRACLIVPDGCFAVRKYGVEKTLSLV